MNPGTGTMDFVTLIYLVLTIAIVGLCVYLIEKYVPMDEVFKMAIRVIVIIVILLFVLQKFLIPLLR